MKGRCGHAIPACDFDQFKNFMAPGDEFTELARTLVS